jgi:3-oxoadipate enol-lactonase
MPAVQLSPSLSLHYLEFNSSGCPPVLLLHGLGATCDSWALQVPALVEAGFRVLAPDARGFGQSSYPGGMSILSLAGDAAHLLEILDAVPAYLVGISMGGVVAQELALKYPRYVRKLVLINTFACLRPTSLKGWLYFSLRFALVHTLGLPAQARKVTRHVFPKPGQEVLREMLYNQIIQANPRAYRAAMRSLARFNSQDRLREIKIPTLVITASEDKTVDPRAQTRLAEQIPGARQVTIYGSSHAVTADQPEALNAALLDFLCGGLVPAEKPAG